MPSRIFAATSGFAAMARSTASPSAPSSETTASPRAGDDRVGLALTGEDAVEHLAGELVVDRPLVDERLDPGDLLRA